MYREPVQAKWLEPNNQKWAFAFQLVAPNNLDDVLGTLEDVDISSVSITESYYTDTRIQAKLDFYGDNTQRQAWIRIVAIETDTGYTKVLGTFIPTSDDVTLEGGVKKTTLNLESALYGVAQQVLNKPWVCYKGSIVYTNLSNVLKNKCNMVALNEMVSLMGETAYDDTYPEYDTLVTESTSSIFSSDYTCDAGSNVLELLYAICNTGGLRMGVSGKGRVFWSKYTAPSSRTSSFDIEVNATDSITLDSVSRSSNYLSMVSQATVHSKNDEEKEIVSTATATGRLASSNRGYIVGKYYDITDMSPFTQARADQLAKEYLARNTNENVEWTLSTHYLPIHAGEVGMLSGLTQDKNYSQSQKVMVKNKELDLLTMTQKLTLKLASSNDEETEG